MIQKLTLRNFKNFRDATLHLGPLTTLVGANAAGKSNVRDALRFLNGVARGYALADIFGEKYAEGVLQWRGLRGNPKELAFHDEPRFLIEAEIDLASHIEHVAGTMFTPPNPISVDYGIEVEVGKKRPRVRREYLRAGDTDLFTSRAQDQQMMRVDVRPGGDYRKGHVEKFAAGRPVLTQLSERIGGKRDDQAAQTVRMVTTGTTIALQEMRFLDLSPDAMRRPSMPGQTTLSDRGENLSSVLQAICEDEEQKAKLVEWVQTLTPMGLADFRFPSEISGKTLAVLVEEDGHETTAYSASDGTLRFLAILAALLGPETTDFYFFEELENGIHPARLDLLLQLIEQSVSANRAQVVATTHSPSLLRLLSEDSLQDASLVFRLEGQPDGHIRRIVDIPEAQRILEERDLALLFESGWMETSMAFAQSREGTASK